MVSSELAVPSTLAAQLAWPSAYQSGMALYAMPYRAYMKQCIISWRKKSRSSSSECPVATGLRWNVQPITLPLLSVQGTV